MHGARVASKIAWGNRARAHRGVYGEVGRAGTHAWRTAAALLFPEGEGCSADRVFRLRRLRFLGLPPDGKVLATADHAIANSRAKAKSQHSIGDTRSFP